MRLERYFRPMRTMRVGDRVANGPHLGTVRSLTGPWVFVGWDDGYPDSREAVTKLKPAPLLIRMLIRWVRA